ncbi:MAG: hypothetical protein ACK2UH_03095, partial [Candidatus Promineifilaceae bacterium]
MKTKIGLIMHYELTTTLKRKSYLFIAFGIPILAILIFVVVNLIKKDSPETDDTSAMDMTELEVEGYVDQAGLIYAVGDEEVKVFDAQGKLQRRWPTERPGYCVAVDGQAAVYVGEVGEVEKFDSTGKRLAVWRDEERLGFVTAIGFFGEFVLIADAKDRCIRRYDDQGRWLNNVGKDNKTRGFLIPNGHLDFSVDQQG